LNLRAGLPLALLCGALAVALPLVGIWREDNARTALEQARIAAQSLDLATLGAVTAETGERGFTITWNVSFLGSYTNGQQQFDSSIAALRGADLPPEVTGPVNEMADAYQVWLVQFADPQVQLVRAGGLNAARARTASGLGQELFDTMQSRSEDAGAAIDREVTARRSAQSRRNLESDGLALLGGIAAAVTAAIVVAGARLRWQEMHRLQAATIELELERELGKRRADVLASVSHDLRSPLAGVVLQASMLEEQAEEEGREELVSMAAAVSRGATRAALLVDELLDFARMESGGMQLEIEPLDLCAVVKEAVEDVRIARPSFAVEIDDQMGEDELVKGDEERLRAVFRNVMDNAARYGKGPYRVRIVPDGTRVDVHLEDGGPGIPESERSAIFQKYERGSTAAGNKGTGLGLYFSRELVALHGGTLAAGASAMGGADFVVSLPRSLNGHSA
jgi:signal transduction histidine kinase